MSPRASDEPRNYLEEACRDISEEPTLTEIIQLRQGIVFHELELANGPREEGAVAGRNATFTASLAV